MQLCNVLIRGMLFNFTEPSDTFYMKNDQGDWVQVVSLIKWKGFLFPYPTFGGVMVIDNGEHNFNDYISVFYLEKEHIFLQKK